PLDRLNLNLITTDRIQYEPSFLATKVYDGLGQTGNHFINFSANETRTINNAVALFGDPEGPGDVPLPPGGDVVVEDLDLVDWSVEVRIY
ncbi:MAG: hypothetical protein QHJ73_06600, partial [Armatimonadota bacterium]|nr:hypothetical protein [Armatimonadota bacterium]